MFAQLAKLGNKFIKNSNGSQLLETSCVALCTSAFHSPGGASCCQTAQSTSLEPVLPSTLIQLRNPHSHASTSAARGQVPAGSSNPPAARPNLAPDSQRQTYWNSRSVRGAHHFAQGHSIDRPTRTGNQSRSMSKRSGAALLLAPLDGLLPATFAPSNRP